MPELSASNASLHLVRIAHITELIPVIVNKAFEFLRVSVAHLGVEHQNFYSRLFFVQSENEP